MTIRPFVTETFRQLPPPGPAWGGSLMGTSIVARLLVEEHLLFLAGIFVAIVCVILAELTVGFARFREPSFRRTTMAEWSMYFTGNSLFRLVGFWIGGLVTVITWAIQLTRFHGAPIFTWGLPLVGPMISASVAGWLARDYGEMYHIMGTVLFFHVAAHGSADVCARVLGGVARQRRLRRREICNGLGAARHHRPINNRDADSLSRCIFRPLWPYRPPARHSIGPVCHGLVLPKRRSVGAVLARMVVVHLPAGND